MPWIVIISVVVACWAMLRVFGNERQQEMQDLEASILEAAIKNQPPSQPMQTPNPQ